MKFELDMAAFVKVMTTSVNIKNTPGSASACEITSRREVEWLKIGDGIPSAWWDTCEPPWWRITRAHKEVIDRAPQWGAGFTTDAQSALNARETSSAYMAAVWRREIRCRGDECRGIAEPPPVDRRFDQRIYDSVVFPPSIFFSIFGLALAVIVIGLSHMTASSYLSHIAASDLCE